MDRKLTPTTIIPPELYVIREADKQLRSVLQDMGRPGYILVARQMGKTNLLLNAKRELEDQNNAFIYIDLSAPFASERECFRHIIETALETRTDLSDKCKRPIFEARKESPPPAYKEHENELRTLLDAITGKLVIILDEIDSLTNTPFSDRIFAQIRSIYFSRTNYRQFVRLTYILSGVVEPNEIIKDKRISPFNIGEKIYLDDFTEDQFRDFLGRADLRLKKEVEDKIFYWASGNPRLTWDICFDIEEKIAQGIFITPEEVDDSVRKLYLTDFARAPIDHIREVAATDDELRNAITVIKYGKGNTLSDATKSKLYLAGIIRSAAKHKDVSIKNKIIEAALSDQWLLDISIKRKGLQRLAAECYHEKRFEEALALYDQVVQNPDISEKDRMSAYWDMGLCAYNAGDYKKALTNLEMAHWDKADSAVLYYERTFYIGISYLKLGNINDSRTRFLETLDTPKWNATYFNALINLGVTYTAEKDYEHAIEYFQSAIARSDNSSLSPEERAKFKTLALYSLSNAYRDAGDKPKSQAHFHEALESCSPRQRPAIMLGMYSGLTIQEEKEQLLTQCLDFIISGSLHPDSTQSEGTLGLTISVFHNLLREAYLVSRPLFDRLFAYASTLAELETSSAELLHKLAYMSVRAGDLKTAFNMSRDAVEGLVPSLVRSKETEFQSYRLLCMLCKGSKKLQYQRKYIECLESGYEPKSIDTIDLKVFSDLAVGLIERKKPQHALLYINMAKHYMPLVASDEIVDYVLFYFYEMLAYRNAHLPYKLKQASHETLEFLESLAGRPMESRFLDLEGIRSVEEFARNNLRPNNDQLAKSATISAGRKHGRNERVSVCYIDGKVIRDVKFKKVESDLAENRCKLIEN
jgi:tetratricopeptide (TPR) repeat protein